MFASLQIPHFAHDRRWSAYGDRLGHLADAVGRRARLAVAHPPEQACSPDLRLLLGELAAFGDPVVRKFREPLVLERASQPKVVILLPGFAAHPMRMRYMARTLEAAGHRVKRWGLGYNMGPTEPNFEFLSRRVEDVRRRYGHNVVLIGWSLGGIYARELAKKHPDIVDKVITLGSPFSHTPYSNNVWRIYQMITGHSVERPPIEAMMREKPPVETVAFWSPRDGIIAPRSACGLPDERDRAVALRCTHMGFSNSAESIAAVARELTIS